MVEWKEFNCIEEIYNPYFVYQGEGKTMANQAVIAVSKLVYKYYNDGDVFDNTYYLDGWCNDLSTYANWLYKYIPEMEILNKISNIYYDSEYESLLYDVAMVLTPEYLEKLDEKEKVGSIYTEEGSFKFEEYSDDEEEW